MRLLIVEDDPMVGQINEKFAWRLPFVKLCHRAENLEAARELLNINTYDLLLLDVYFPRGKGPDLLSWIRNEEISVHVIFITADNSRATVERATHLGALDYLMKPFTFERFKSALEKAEKSIESLRGEGALNQDYLDRVFHHGGEESNCPKNELDKGMSYKTYEVVKEEINRMKGSFTAEQIGERLGMARVTIRRYLDYMEKTHYLDVDLKYGKVGRPQHQYRRKGSV